MGKRFVQMLSDELCLLFVLEEKWKFKRIKSFAILENI